MLFRSRVRWLHVLLVSRFIVSRPVSILLTAGTGARSVGNSLTLPFFVASIDHVISAPHVWLLQEDHNIDRIAKERRCTDPLGLGAFGALLRAFAV